MMNSQFNLPLLHPHFHHILYNVYHRAANNARHGFYAFTYDIGNYINYRHGYGTTTQSIYQTANDVWVGNTTNHICF